MFTKT